ncbi:MAG: hypothetical protein ACLGHL_08970 [Actinomycetota bacterium]
MRRISAVLGVALLGAVLAAGPATTAGNVKTTLDRTIVGDAQGSLRYGPGETRMVRKLDWDRARGKGTPVAGFKQLSDVHTIDEESPGRVEFFDMCDPSLSSAYRVQEAMSTQVGEAMLQVLSALNEGPATGRSLDFTISTGDNIDSNQLNELRWFIDLLDGKNVTPDSGAPGYDGYTQAQFSGALPDEILEEAQQPFNATGTKQPWYVVLGNHDGLIQGSITRSPAFRAVVIRNQKVFQNLEEYDCPESLDSSTLAAEFTRLYTESATEVPADESRTFLDKSDLIKEFDDTSGAPRGHGLRAAPDDPLTSASDKAGYYAFDISRKVVGISMDTISYSGGPEGQLDDAQFRWIEDQLRRNSKTYYDAEGVRRRNTDGRNKLIVLFSHHTSQTLANTSMPDEVPEGMAPLHCYSAADGEGCADGEGLGSLLTRYPNVVAWVNGHEHNNRISPIHAPTGTDPARGLWEVNTAAHIDWPQQSRLIEIAYKPGRNGKPGSVFIYTTVVDHAAKPDPDNETDPVMRLAAISRVEAYFDACIRENQATCAANGTPGDRNVKLVQKAPFRF